MFCKIIMNMNQILNKSSMMKNRLFGLVYLLLGMAVGAQATGHWTINPYDFQYDMALYFTVSINNMHISDLSDYEVAAFCDEECRGVATVYTIENDSVAVSFGYLRIRSNQAKGEKISFKLYDYVKGEEKLIEDTMDFVANGVEGLPSNPIVISDGSYLRGDSNGDGEIGMPDVMFIINYILGTPESSFNADAADANMDGEVGMPDVMFIVNYIFNGKFPDE